MFELILAVISLVLGAGLGYALIQIRYLKRIRDAELDAERMVEAAQEKADELTDDVKERCEEARESLFAAHERELNQLAERVAKREESYREARSQVDREFNQDRQEVQKSQKKTEEFEQVLRSREERYQAVKAKGREIKSQLIDRLAQITGQNLQELKTQLAQTFENDLQVDAKRKATAYEEEVRLHSDEMARKLIGNALNRFPRASCLERGIGIVEIPNNDVKARMRGPNDENIKALAASCGVDININDDNTVQITGFDPVRRELATRTLERLVHEKKPNLETVDRLIEKCKTTLFNRIEEDGRRVANELGAGDLHPEVKKMLGSLRYRYSFAQNQHFHVAEVGWLCGLLASELGGVDRRDAKRSGLLHDVGKAMDHSIEGGHAVIGADFIQKHGERAEIVHAVRSHHYEETPNTDLAFLVIAADAMSGARPGARRSTASSYNQKIEVLSSIGDDFPGVTKTLVFNAGREVRILVDEAKVTDETALHLCRQIADKIEQTCSYPGQIKVVVVRERHAEAFAK